MVNRSFKTTISALAGALALTLVGSSSVMAAPAQETIDVSKVFSQEQQAALKQIIHQYIVENPEILVEAAQALDAKKAASQESALATAALKVRADKMVPMRGTGKAKNYLIEFFDYNCGYCKVVRPHIKRLQQEQDVDIYYVELPILSPMSVRAAALGLALFKQDPKKYLAYQDRLMTENVRLSKEEEIAEAIKAVGGDYDKASKAVEEDKSIEEALRSNFELSQSIGVQGTPFFILNGTAIRGAIKDYKYLEDIVKKTQAK